MKDLPHHVKKLNRQVVRSEHREILADEDDVLKMTPPRKQTPHQLKKQKKARMAKAKDSRTPTPLTPEERNKKMAEREKN